MYIAFFLGVLQNNVRGQLLLCEGENILAYGE